MAFKDQELAKAEVLAAILESKLGK